jgi:plastocyanin
VTIWDTGFCSNTGNCGYSAQTKTATTGTNITWTNTGGQPHTTTECTPSDNANACPDGAGSNTSAARAFDSPTLGKNSQYSYTFHALGTFHYYCTIHPWMHGTIIVG